MFNDLRNFFTASYSRVISSTDFTPRLIWGRVLDVYSRRPGTVIVTSIAALFIPAAIKNYRSYVALGPGGMPNYIVGWIVGYLLKPLGRETRSTLEYEPDRNGPDGWVKWLKDSDVPKRLGPRPTVASLASPHRQTDQIPSDAVKSSLSEQFHEIAQDNERLVDVKLSPNEKRDDAMVVHPSLPLPNSAAKAAKGEIAHIHTFKDYSLHVVLAPLDCKLVIEQGWGERHPMSGRIKLPKEWLLIYAPRNDHELRVVSKIIRASIGFMTGSHAVQ